MKPRLSYTIWFTQRTGSSLLCKTLESTGIAGIPAEWLYDPNEQDLRQYYGVRTYAELQQHLWSLGSTPNGVFGVKFSWYEPCISNVLETFRNFPGYSDLESPRATIWNYAFPNGRHIFMTRRNKVRLAVSWWKAIKTEEWHRTAGASTPQVDLSDAYSFKAINHLYRECSMREAGIQEFFSEAGIVPFTVVYEDFILEYERTVQRILEYLELDSNSIAIPRPYYERLADDVSEIWVQRFREERQQGWRNRGW